MKPFIIGLHGVQRAGKDTTADFIESILATSGLTIRRRGFADKVKLAFARQFFPDITQEAAIEWCESFKFTGDVHLSWDWHGQAGDQVHHFVPGRSAMAQFATEGARDIYGQNFWVDQLLPMPLAVLDDASREPVLDRWHSEFLVNDALADVGIITDVRFENEVQRIHAIGGVLWKIKRKDAEDAVIAEAKRAGREVHRSELGLPDKMFDVVINNDDNDLEHARVRTVRALSTTYINTQT